LLDQEKKYNKVLKLPQICSEKCEHQVFEILVINLKGKYEISF